MIDDERITRITTSLERIRNILLLVTVGIWFIGFIIALK